MNSKITLEQAIENFERGMIGKGGSCRWLNVIGMMANENPEAEAYLRKVMTTSSEEMPLVISFAYLREEVKNPAQETVAALEFFNLDPTNKARIEQVNRLVENKRLKQQQTM